MTTTREQFQSRLADSGILTAAELSAFADAAPASAAAEDPRALAEALVEAQHLTPFQAEVLLAETTRPLRLGNYLLLDRVGSGGMGHVHKAVHERMNRIVALKILPPLAAMDAALVARFRREVQVAAKLHHPHIVTAYDADEAEGLHFLVMELVEGPDLARVVSEEGPLSVDAALGTIEQAAEALAYAHSEGVLHRDVKPANLLVDSTGHVKVLDMGLARLDSSEGLTTTGEFIGTAMTMAPEQGDDVSLVDERSDVYGLGCTLYFLLTGKHVYQGDSAVQVLLAHARDPVPRLRDLCPDAPASVERLFESMVQKNRDDRPPNMRAVVEGIQAIRAGEQPDVPPAPKTRRKRGALPLPRWVWPMAALALIALVVGLILGLRGEGGDVANAPVATPELEPLRTLYGHQGSVHAVIVHPDGRRILSASGDHTIGIWDLETGSLRGRMEGHTLSVRSLACLRNGRTLISSSDDTTVRIWDLETRTTTKVLKGHEAKVRQIRLAPDESWLVSASKDGTLRIWDLPAGTVQRTLSEHGVWVGDNRGYLSVAMRPDGLAFATSAFDRTLRVWDTETFDVVETVGPDTSDIGVVAFSADGSRLFYDRDGGRTRVMDGDGSRELAELVGHEDWVYSITCAAGLPIVATGSQDWTIRLWNYETGEELATLVGHEFTIGGLAFTEDARLLVSGAGDETVRLWDVSSITRPGD